MNEQYPSYEQPNALRCVPTETIASNLVASEITKEPMKEQQLREALAGMIYALDNYPRGTTGFAKAYIAAKQALASTAPTWVKCCERMPTEDSRKCSAKNGSTLAR